MLYSKSIGNMFASVMHEILSGGNLTLYSGTQPSAADFVTNWASTYNSTHSNFLLHLTTVNLDVLNYRTGNFSWTASTSGYGSVTLNATKPTAQVATNTGTATWGVFWGMTTPPALSALGVSTIPNNRFVIFPVTNLTGTGVIKMTSTALTQGLSYTIDEFQFITITSGGV